MEFCPIELAQRERIEEIRKTYGFPLSSHAFSSIFLWRSSMVLSVFLLEDAYFIRSRENGIFRYFFPCGSRKAKRNILSSLSPGTELLYVSAPDCLFLEQEFPGMFSLVEDRASWEYLYDRHQQEAMEGHEYKRIRQQVNRIVNTGFSAELLDEGNLLQAEEAAKKWFQLHSRKKGMMDAEGTFAALRNFQELSLFGIFVRGPGGEAAAFSLGSFLDDRTFDSHIAKSLVPNIDFYFKYCLTCALPSGITVINREEDLGISGLRRHKTALRPCGFNRLWKGVKQR